ncbi:MAG: hypothetical protein KatS3mg097_542 [Candidatus Parcubacteria bacterium]|nr:MAG: hypothetical protein KatS3mg097_542 [Candidatus Parcubacteria bacterium]
MSLQNNYNIFEKINNLDIKEVIQRETDIAIPNRRTPQIKCPFHNDNHPSFTIYPKTNSWYCFGCGKGGNVISFIKICHNLTTKDAIRYLKKHYLREIDDIEEKTEEAASEGFYKLIDLTEELKDWLKKRKLTDETIAKFGFSCFKDKKGNYWIGIPIFDESGKIVNYKIRRDPLKENPNLEKYKWLRSGTKKTLFPINCVDFEKEEIYLVEGELDAILLNQEGFNVLTIAGGGTTKWLDEWVDIIRRFKKIFLIPDRDETGKTWLNNLINKLSLSVSDVYIINLPCGKDVTEFYQQGGDLKTLNYDYIEKLKKGFFTIDDLLSETEDQLEFIPLIGENGFIVKGWTHILSAYPKTGKTELIFRNCLGWAENYKILYLSEESKSLWKKRIKNYEEFGLFEGLDFEKIKENLLILPALALGIEGVNEIVKNLSPDILIIDTLRSIVGNDIRDETSASEVSNLLLNFLRFLQERRTTLIVLHHTIKSEQGIKSIAGTHALAGMFDILITLNIHENNKKRRILRSQGRIIEPKELVYEFDENGKLKSINISEEENILIEEAVINFLQENSGKELTTSEIYSAIKEELENEGIKITRKKLKASLDRLYDKGSICRNPKENKKGATYRWFLNEKSEDAEVSSKESLSILDIQF